MQGLNLDNDGLAVGNRARASDSHDLILLEQVDKKNFSENENNKNWGLAFSPVDISLCFGIYVLSAVILIVVKHFRHLLSFSLTQQLTFHLKILVHWISLMLSF